MVHISRCGARRGHPVLPRVTLQTQKITILCVTGLIVAAGLAFARWGPDVGELSDYIQFKLSPRSFLDSHVAKLRNGDVEILLVGTMHDRHLGHAQVGLSTFERLLDSYEPDRIGLEIRPKDIDRDLTALSPVDMIYLFEVANRRNLPVLAFDDWDEKAYADAASNRKMPDFNSEDRNDAMAALLHAGLRPGRTIAFTGYAHVGPIIERLTARGFIVVKDRAEQTSLEPGPGPNRLPPQLVPRLLRGVEELDAYLGDHPEPTPWTHRIAAKRRRLQSLADAAHAPTTGG